MDVRQVLVIGVVRLNRLRVVEREYRGAGRRGASGKPAHARSSLEDAFTVEDGRPSCFSAEPLGRQWYSEILVELCSRKLCPLVSERLRVVSCVDEAGDGADDRVMGAAPFTPQCAGLDFRCLIGFTGAARNITANGECQPVTGLWTP